MKKLIIITLAFGIFVGCKNEEKQPVKPLKSYDRIEDLQWLIGNWTNISEESQSYENWSKLNDSTLFSHSFTLVENDTVFAEHVLVQQNKDEVLFTVTAYNQNDNRPVIFKMLPTDNKVYTFENPDHDFPTKISYSNPVKDSIFAWIEGTIKGENRKVDFKFKRK
ncbi:DUF6265 family protein [Formosa maritima]|uniref:DUF6265 domain-containing protein n=1 Tax=Formosa maritima TaxID=2592046 RepID=A0A5D0G8J2_9FLAO|nr:DUF6265 family protein [Formosa maritima]TYA55154.1 hypothetical protein FVF61_07790 [Formosa maritima]